MRRINKVWFSAVEIDYGIAETPDWIEDDDCTIIEKMAERYKINVNDIEDLGEDEYGLLHCYGFHLLVNDGSGGDAIVDYEFNTIEVEVAV